MEENNRKVVLEAFSDTVKIWIWILVCAVLTGAAVGTAIGVCMMVLHWFVD